MTIPTRPGVPITSLATATKADPLEAAKIQRPGTEAPQQVLAVAPVKVAAPPPPVVAAGPPPPRWPRYRVKASRFIASPAGHLTHLMVGEIVDSAGYGGEKGIASLREQGAELEKIEE